MAFACSRAWPERESAERQSRGRRENEEDRQTMRESEKRVYLGFQEKEIEKRAAPFFPTWGELVKAWVPPSSDFFRKSKLFLTDNDEKALFSFCKMAADPHSSVFDADSDSDADDDADLKRIKEMSNEIFRMRRVLYEQQCLLQMLGPGVDRYTLSNRIFDLEIDLIEKQEALEALREEYKKKKRSLI
ncbi:hypothetical protein QL285_040127 [Trifolium repens]|nr:hypothetical protein QL285_040127 [Trifolium repens]